MLSSRSFAGTRDGGGGNSIICKNKNGAITSVELLDYFEVRLSGGTLKFNPNLKTYEIILKDLFLTWQAVAPQRMAQYQGWLDSFSTDAGVYPGVEIPAIPDTGTIAIPEGCEVKPIAYQRPDDEILPGVKRYTINKDIWDLMPEIQKAGLVLRELIYREGIKVGHTTSFPTRNFNGFLASTTPQSEAYTSIVSQLPLEWVEFGGGMTLSLGPKQTEGQKDQPFKVYLPFTSDGYLDCKCAGPTFDNVQGIYGNVVTKNLKIEMRDENSVSYGSFGFFKMGLLFIKGYVPLKRIYAVFENSVVDFVNPASTGTKRVEISTVLDLNISITTRD